MSADNWAQCPKCHDLKLKAWQQAVRDKQEYLASVYGKVTAEEYMLLVDKPVDVENPGEMDEDNSRTATFREDYEFYGARDGVVEVSYRGGCAVCDLQITIDESYPLY
jgi:hypothetical protein